MKRKKKVLTVSDRLRSLGQINVARGSNYGRFDKIGRVLHEMFPEGLTVRGPAEFNRLVLFIMIANKVTRLANSLPGGIHEDTLDDTAVYSMMMRTHEDEIK